MKLITSSISLITLTTIFSPAQAINHDSKPLHKRTYGTGQNYGGNWGQGSGLGSMGDAMAGKYSPGAAPYAASSSSMAGEGVAATSVSSMMESSSVAMSYGYESTATSASYAAVATGAVSTGTGMVHQVTVGQNGLAYTPNFVMAAIGDTVVFEFYPKNHSLTQSSFKTPCLHLVDSTGMAIGIDSSFMPVAPGATSHPTFIITVEETTPLWFFCAQGNHCEQGMGFAINPPTSGNTIEAYLAKAMNVTAATTTDSIVESLRTSASGLVGAASSTMDSTATTTDSAPLASSTSTNSSTGYGSGSAGNSDGFNACISTCQVTFGQTLISTASTATTSNSSNSSASSSNSTGPHTVTQSSALEICNKTLAPGAFASGQQNKTFRFPVVIAQDKTPTWYYCGVKSHCEMGMFGVVNPARTTVVATSFGSWMDTHASSNSDFAQIKSDTDKMCAGTPSMTWGSMFDLSALDPLSLPMAAESVMMTRQYYFANPQVLLAQSNNSTSSSTLTGSSLVPASTGTGSSGANGALISTMLYSAGVELRVGVLAGFITILVMLF